MYHYPKLTYLKPVYEKQWIHHIIEHETCESTQTYLRLHSTPFLRLKTHGFVVQTAMTFLEYVDA